MVDKAITHVVKGQSFLGCHMAQYWVDLVLWERFLNRHQLASIVELGTGGCGLSLFLASQAYQRGIEFWTFDRKTSGNLDTPLAKLLGLRAHFVPGNLFTGARPKLVELLQGLPRPLLLFCDNGNKPKEFREFVPYLWVGDYVGVHDWGTEIGEKDVHVLEGIVEPLHLEEWAAAGSITRFMRVLK